MKTTQDTAKLSPNATNLLTAIRGGTFVRNGYDAANVIGITSSAGAASVLRSLERKGLIIWSNCRYVPAN